MELTLTKDCEVRRYLRYSWRICDLDGADTDMMACDSSGRWKRIVSDVRSVPLVYRDAIQ